MSEAGREWIRELEAEWGEPAGFLYRLRKGLFDVRQAERFIQTLQSMRNSHEEPLDRRFVSLVWYVPLFLHWQTKRIAENGGDVLAFEQFSNRIQTIVEEILGVP